jgi:hypothetical protein
MPALAAVLTAPALISVAVHDCHFAPVGGCFDGGIRESGMSKAGLDNRKQDGEIGHKHGATPIGTLRKIYGQGFAAGYPPTDKLSDVFVYLNETSLSQLRRDYKTGHLDHKITNALH